MFSHLPTPTLDPILSLSVAYRNDPRPDKVDLGIGVYKNSTGETPIMKAISQAQDIVVETQKRNLTSVWPVVKSLTRVWLICCCRALRPWIALQPPKRRALVVLCVC